ncbi:MAG: thioesterase [Emergencia sp.]|nr:thioesterase [Emergencia sp.]
MRYTEHYEVSSHDVDTNNYIRPSLLQRYLIETADHQMRDRKPTYYELFVEGKAFILTRISIEYYGQISKYDRIDVQTWRCPEKGATFIRCFTVFKEGKLMAKGYSVWAVVNHRTGKLCRASEVDISGYETEEPHRMQLPDRFRLPKDIEYIHVGNKKVFLGETDINGHMNNTYYADILWSFIPDVLQKTVTSVNLRFQHEALLGEEMEVFMGRMKEPLAEDEQADETWCFYSKVNGQINIEAEIGVKHIL